MSIGIAELLIIGLLVILIVIGGLLLARTRR